MLGLPVHAQRSIMGTKTAFKSHSLAASPANASGFLASLLIENASARAFRFAPTFCAEVLLIKATD